MSLLEPQAEPLRCFGLVTFSIGHAHLCPRSCSAIFSVLLRADTHSASAQCQPLLWVTDNAVVESVLIASGFARW